MSRKSHRQVSVGGPTGLTKVLARYAKETLALSLLDLRQARLPSLHLRLRTWLLSLMVKSYGSITRNKGTKLQLDVIKQLLVSLQTICFLIERDARGSTKVLQGIVLRSLTLKTQALDLELMRSLNSLIRR